MMTTISSCMVPACCGRCRGLWDMPLATTTMIEFRRSALFTLSPDGAAVGGEGRVRGLRQELSTSLQQNGMAGSGDARAVLSPDAPARQAPPPHPTLSP